MEIIDSQSITIVFMVMLVSTKLWLRTYSWLNTFQIINRQPGNDVRYLKRLFKNFPNPPSKDKPHKIFAIRLEKKNVLPLIRAFCRKISTKENR